MSKDNAAKETIWSSGKRKHEGFPLHLRFPGKPDFDSLQKKYPKRLIVTHALEKVTNLGEPESAYNKTLADFDHEMIVAFDNPKTGLTVLVETFGGNRAYYMYVSSAAPVDQVKSQFSEKYPQHDLTWDLDDDPNWNLIRNYSKDYELYGKTT